MRELECSRIPPRRLSQTERRAIRSDKRCRSAGKMHALKRVLINFIFFASRAPTRQLDERARGRDTCTARDIRSREIIIDGEHATAPDKHRAKCKYYEPRSVR